MYHGMFLHGRSENHAARDASQMAHAARSDARRTRSRIDELEERIEQLALMTEALWLLLRERAGLEESELATIARDLDLSDGRLDGKVRRTAVKCLGCGRMVGKRHAACFYCGADVDRAPFSGT